MRSMTLNSRADRGGQILDDSRTSFTVSPNGLQLLISWFLRGNVMFLLMEVLYQISLISLQDVHICGSNVYYPSSFNGLVLSASENVITLLDKSSL